MSTTKHSFDVVIVGAGIVGLTIAYELKSRMPALSLAILEKEREPGLHASGRNSGVLHTGIYYPPHTRKSEVCAQGSLLMRAFADDHGIPYRKSGKLIVATDEAQLPVLSNLLENAYAHDISAECLDIHALRAYEPEATNAIAALYCKDTAVIDSKMVVKKLYALLEDKGVRFFWNCPVLGAHKNNVLITHGQDSFSYGYLFNCAGAHADVLAHQFGLASQYALIPFKGLYWKLSLEANALVQSNIYPVPDLRLPFLGVHATRVMSGEVYVGPTAIPVLGRENYHRLQGANMQETMSIAYRIAHMYLKNKNNFRLLAKTELAKYHKRTFLAAAQNLVPKIQLAHLVKTPKVGIRPQLMNTKTGLLEMDYVFEKTDTSMHILNAISPAFTSSFAFAKMILGESGLNICEAI